MGKTVRAVSHVEDDHAADSNIEAAVNAALAKKEDMFEKLLQMQQSTFQACLQSFVEATNKRFDNLVRNNAKEIAELRASVQFTQKETDDMKQAVRSQSEQVRDNIRGIDAAAAAQREIEDGIDYMENQTRRNNLRIDGVIESPAETWADTEAAVRKTLVTSLKLSERHANDIRIERAHRTGGDNHSDRPKTVVVKFESYKDRDTVMRAARKEKPRGVFVNEDLSQRVMARRRELMPRLREARQQGKIAYLSYDRLVVRDRVERT